MMQLTGIIQKSAVGRVQVDAISLTMESHFLVFLFDLLSSLAEGRSTNVASDSEEEASLPQRGPCEAMLGQRSQMMGMPPLQGEQGNYSVSN